MLDRILSLEIVRVTERAAVAAARLRGRGNEKAADQAAVDAMRREINKLPIDGTVVIGEGERDEAPMLFIGEKVGTEATARRSTSRSIRSKAPRCAPRTCRARSPPWRWRKAARCSTRPTSTWRRSRSAPAIRQGVVDLDAPAEENIRALAKAKGVKPDDITALILDRPRHADLVAAVRKAGASVRFITDGDVAGVIHTADPDATGIDIYLGIGGAPEGVLAAAALRLHRRPDAGPPGARHRGEARARRARWASRTRARNTTMEDMVQGDCVFAATGVTTGSMLQGVRFRPGVIETETVVMRSATGTVRWIRAEHRHLDKFEGKFPGE